MNLDQYVSFKNFLYVLWDLKLITSRTHIETVAKAYGRLITGELE